MLLVVWTWTTIGRGQKDIHDDADDVCGATKLPRLQRATPHNDHVTTIKIMCILDLVENALQPYVSLGKMQVEQDGHSSVFGRVEAVRLWSKEPSRETCTCILLR